MDQTKPDRYKAWVNDVSLRANQNQMAWIMKITKRLEEAPNFTVSRVPPLRYQFLDEAQTAHDELLAEIQRSAETDAGEDPAEDEQADDVTFDHKMMYPAEPDWNVTSEDFADEDLVSLSRGDEKKKSLTAMYGFTSRGACPLLKPGLSSFALQQALRASALACSLPT